MKTHPIPTIFAIASLITLSLECKKNDPISKVISVEDVNLDLEEIQLTVEETAKLTAFILPEDAANKNVVWTSGTPGVATVSDNGTVKGISAGKAIVTVTTVDGGRTADCTVTVKDKESPSVLSGVFSTGSDTKVHFSKGNLFYDGNTFNFEVRQYDVPENWSASHAGYFFWSSSVAIATASAYSESGVSPSDIIFTNAGIDTASPDFCSGGVRGAFRTLSPAEWQYLIKNRTNASNLYRKGVNVCGSRNCIVLAPDGFQGIIADEYSNDAWAEAETSGMVCLPAAGYRDGFNVINSGTNGYYWASSASYGSISANVTFDCSSLNTSSFAMRYIGYPIRLVVTEK